MAVGRAHYNYYRDYDPSLGRYVESDPLGVQVGRDTFGYVRGNPIARVDPDGLLDKGAGGGGGSGLGGQGICYLMFPLAVVPGTFNVCIYRCESFECPPRVWIETTISTWKWGCLDKRAATGHRGPTGPRRS